MLWGSPTWILIDNSAAMAAITSPFVKIIILSLLRVNAQKRQFLTGFLLVLLWSCSYLVRDLAWSCSEASRQDQKETKTSPKQDQNKCRKKATKCSRHFVESFGGCFSLLQLLILLPCWHLSLIHPLCTINEQKSQCILTHRLLFSSYTFLIDPHINIRSRITSLAQVVGKTRHIKTVEHFVTRIFNIIQIGIAADTDVLI